MQVASISKSDKNEEKIPKIIIALIARQELFEQRIFEQLLFDLNKKNWQITDLELYCTLYVETMISGDGDAWPTYLSFIFI